MSTTHNVRKRVMIGMQHLEITPQSSLEDEIIQLVYKALGEASMCWSNTPNGIFMSTEVRRIGNRLVEDMKKAFSEI